MAKKTILRSPWHGGFRSVSIKVPLTPFEERRLDALTGPGKRLKRQAFAREAILAQLAREEQQMKDG